uniref:Uncharacterized protein n=1 Tax=Oryza meridionalis TaxID=40149 RepID=A0A0E0DBX4_9ORYZ
MAFSGGQRMITGTSVSRQPLAVHGLGRLSGVHGNSSEMVRDAAGADDASRAPSSGAPAGVLFKQQDNITVLTRASGKSTALRRRGRDRQGDDVQASRRHRRAVQKHRLNLDGGLPMTSTLATLAMAVHPASSLLRMHHPGVHALKWSKGMKRK